jgi:hypothetical protein
MLQKQQNTIPLREQATSLLVKVEGEYSDIERALSNVNLDVVVRDKLSGDAAKAMGAANKLSEALSSSSFKLSAAEIAVLASNVSAEVATLLAEAADESSKSASGSVMSLGAASSATRLGVMKLSNDVFEKRVFDPYLHFDSEEEREAFLRREAESRKYIDSQLARNTPDGNLHAAIRMQGYMADAHNHGAGDSPEFLKDWDLQANNIKEQRAVLIAQKISTQEYDNDLSDIARNILRHQKKSDTEIDNILAASDNPLDAVRPYLANDNNGIKALKQVANVAKEARQAKASALPKPETATDPQKPDDSQPLSMDAISASLKAKGVQMSDPTGSSSGHGLSTQKPAVVDAQSVSH